MKKHYSKTSVVNSFTERQKAKFEAAYVPFLSELRKLGKIRNISYPSGFVDVAAHNLACLIARPSK